MATNSLWRKTGIRVEGKYTMINRKKMIRPSMTHDKQHKTCKHHKHMSLTNKLYIPHTNEKVAQLSS